MTNISKIPVAPTTFRKIRKNFLSAVSSNHAHGPRILEDLLTHTERIMLSKRLAIIILLERGVSYYRISKVLKVGVSTVIRTDRHRKMRHYSAIQEALKSHGSLSLLENLELLAAMGMPSRAGPRYNKRLERLRSKKI